MCFIDNQFQHTAARRRLGDAIAIVGFGFAVSTHSRPKAAGNIIEDFVFRMSVSTHSRPKAAGKTGRLILPW